MKKLETIQREINIPFLFLWTKTQEYRVANHSVHVIFTSTCCDQNFDRANLLEVLRKHQEECALMVPKFRRICRICSLVCSLNCHHRFSFLIITLFLLPIDMVLKTITQSEIKFCNFFSFSLSLNRVIHGKWYKKHKKKGKTSGELG